MPLIVALTSTVARSLPAGGVALHAVLLTQLYVTFVIAPNRIFEPVVPTMKPSPLMTTSGDPPASGPWFGLTLRIVGMTRYWSALTAAVVPPGVVTFTSTVSTACAGE